MTCIYCGLPIPRRRGPATGEFCSDEHQTLHQFESSIAAYFFQLDPPEFASVFRHPTNLAVHPVPARFELTVPSLPSANRLASERPECLFLLPIPTAAAGQQTCLASFPSFLDVGWAPAPEFPALVRNQDWDPLSSSERPGFVPLAVTAVAGTPNLAQTVPETDLKAEIFWPQIGGERVWPDLREGGWLASDILAAESRIPVSLAVAEYPLPIDNFRVRLQCPWPSLDPAQSPVTPPEAGLLRLDVVPANPSDGPGIGRNDAGGFKARFLLPALPGRSTSPAVPIAGPVFSSDWMQVAVHPLSAPVPAGEFRGFRCPPLFPGIAAPNHLPTLALANPVRLCFSIRAADPEKSILPPREPITTPTNIHSSCRPPAHRDEGSWPPVAHLAALHFSFEARQLDGHPPVPDPRGVRSASQMPVLGPRIPAPRKTGFWHSVGMPSGLLHLKPRYWKMLASLVPVLLAALVDSSGSPFNSHPPANVDKNRSMFSAPMRKIGDNLRERAAVDLKEDFRSGLDNWESQGQLASAWGYDRNGFVLPGPLAIYRPSRKMTDYQVDVLGQIEQRALAFAYRVEDWNNYYALKLVITKPGPQPSLELIRYSVVNGRERDRESRRYPPPVRNSTLYQFHLDVTGTDFTLITQGKIVDYWSDGRFGKGGVGFFSSRGEKSKIRSLELKFQDDWLGRFCALLTPYNDQTRNRLWEQK